MKKLLVVVLLLIASHSYSQSVFGYWYVDSNVKTNSSANNYLVELVLHPENNIVKGILNYYFKDTYRSVQVQGNYNPALRALSLYNVPVVYHGSRASLEVDCIMNFQGTLRVSQNGSDLIGSFISLPEYKNMCPPVNFNLHLNADISKRDSVLKAISEFKETRQVWKPGYNDTDVLVVNTPERKVVNYVTEKEYAERENIVVSEIEVDSDSLKISLYDNGEIDGDMISLFYNKQLILSNQKLTHKSIRMNIRVDSTITYNELSMFAENLGLIPPNTALLVIEDGKNKHELRLSSNLEKNATIRIRKKKLN